MSSKFHDNPQTYYGATTRGVRPAEIEEYYRREGLSDYAIGREAQHPDVTAEEERLRASQIDSPLPGGWLDDVNGAEQALADTLGAEMWVEGAGIYEPSAAERAAGEVVADRQMTESIVAVRRSEYTKIKLAGMTQDMFDLGA